MKLKLIHFIAFIIAVFGLSPIYAESLAKAELEYDAKNYIAAFKIWNEQAKLHEPAAISGLGQLYLFGQGVAKDEKHAFNLLKKAAELGDARGQSGLGLIFYWGYGVPKDYAQAIQWFQQAANQNRHQAQHSLARMYQDGQGVTQDFKKAVYWHERASNLGNFYSKTQLSRLYAAGQGVEQDYLKSFELARQAAAYGETLAQTQLGFLYTYGNGVERNYEQAVYWYQQAAEKGDSYAESMLGYFYWNGLGVERDYKLAIEWYKKAGAGGNKFAISQLGTALFAGVHVPKDESAAAYWFRKGAEQGETLAQTQLGYLYAYGNGIERNYEQAVYWYRQAAEKGDSNAESMLGHFYWNGVGVERDYKLAIEWYKKAGAGGNKFAISQLSTELLTGKNIPKDEAAAANWFRKGAELSDNYSKAMLGYLYEFGFGLPRSESIAAEWYARILSSSGQQASLKSSADLIQLDFNNLTETGIFQNIPRLNQSYQIHNTHDLVSASTLQARQAWDELKAFLRKSDNFRLALTVYEKPISISLDTDELKREKVEIKSAAAVLAELYSTPSAISQLTPAAREWLDIMNITLRSKADPDIADREKLGLGTRLVNTYNQSDILYLQGTQFLWEVWILRYYKSRDSEFKREAITNLRKIIASWVQPVALLNKAHFNNHSDYKNEYCNVLSNVLLLYKITPPLSDFNTSISNIRLYRTILEDATYCAISNSSASISILRNLQQDLTVTNKLKEAFQIGEIISNFESASASTASLIAGHVERGYRLAGLGKNQEAFVEMVQARHISKEGQDFGWLDEANRALSKILVNLGDPNGAISLLTPQLHKDHLSSDAYSFCLTASAINFAMKAAEVPSAGIPLLKACIDLFFSKENHKSPNSSYANWLFFEPFFKELEESLINAGRLAEAQVVTDMFSEQEYLDFTRRSNSGESRQTRISYTPTEERWMGRYREIADRLAALGKEEQALQKQAKLGLTDEQKKRQAALTADLKVAQTAFEFFLDQMRQEFAAKGPARAAEFTESSVKALAELQDLLKGLGDDVALLRIYLTDENVNFLLTTPGVQLARSVKIKTQDLSRQVAEFGRLLRDPKSDPLPAAQALYKLLLAPVEQDLAQAGAKTVMLSLDGVLRYLPFGVLHDGQRFALQRWNLPIYTSVVRERLRDATNANWQAVGLGVTRAHGSFKALPAVRTEMNSIIRTGASGVLPGEVHLDEAFTAQRLKAVSQRQFSVVHVASHFQFSPGTEVNSFLLLGDGAHLTLGDIRTQNYRFDDVDLLTLSACDTGLGGGRDQRGREIEGFGVIAQQQGAKAVLATLWQVADSSTATLMGDMYLRRTQSGLSKIEALRQAQVALASQPRTAHPYYWAPFILMGNWK